MAYRFIQNYGHVYGVRWLLRKFGIGPNAYYNYLKNRKADYSKQMIKDEIASIYRLHNGVDGYRTIHAYLNRRGYTISRLTVHRYMNTELQLFSIAKKRKPDYEYSTLHKVFDNKLKQNFKAEEINQKWCTDFTYLFLADGSKRYNCSIINLHDRSLVASIHRFLLDCCGITQSMSKVGYPYDNAPMERYYNTLKNELIDHHYYHSEQELYDSIEEFAYVHYNHVRPHSYHNYKTPFEASYGA